MLFPRRPSILQKLNKTTTQSDRISNQSHRQRGLMKLATENLEAKDVLVKMIYFKGIYFLIIFAAMASWPLYAYEFFHNNPSLPLIERIEYHLGVFATCDGAED